MAAPWTPGGLVFVVLLATSAAAQEAAPVAVTLQKAVASAAAAEPGSVITTVFAVVNRSVDPVTMRPEIRLPDGWSVVLGNSPVHLSPGETDTWMVSLRIATRAPADTYVIGVRLANTRPELGSAADSIVVRVNEHRALSLTALNVPEYVVGRQSYQVRFLLQNRGNAPAAIDLAAQLSTPRHVWVEPARITLTAEESQTVTVRVGERLNSDPIAEELVELRATDSSSPGNSALGSARLNIVAQGSFAEPFEKVPAQLKVRARGQGAVAPYEITGSGPLGEGSGKQLDFTFRGPAAKSSPLGEREEYRLDLKSSAYRLRLGDNYFLLSPLTGGGQTGFGAGLDATLGSTSARAYSQRFRFQPGRASESGASLTFRPSRLSWLSALSSNAVRRHGADQGQILSGGATIRPGGDATLDLEYAGSRSDSGGGRAHSVRLSGGTRVRYDLSQSRGEMLFAGPTRGAEDTYASATAKVSDDWELIGVANRHRFERMAGPLLATQQRRMATAGARYGGNLTVEYNVVATSYSAERVTDNAHGGFARARIEKSFDAGGFWANGELGSSRVDSSRLSQPHRQLSIGLNARKGSNSFSIFTDVFQGGALVRSASNGTAIGGSVQLQLPAATALSATGYSARYSARDFRGYSQLDARLSHALRHGAFMSIRTRLWTEGNPTAWAERITYLEYQMPLGVPVRRHRSPGRVEGRVVEATTGRGVPAALIRLGSRTALTDEQGRVSFVGLPGGDYRIALGRASAIGAVLSGDPTITVDTAAKKPVTFQLSVTSGATVRGSVVQWDRARTSLDGRPDSLEYGGPLSRIPVAVIVGRDTLYSATDTSGNFSFTDIPPGDWKVMVMTPAPGQYRYEQEAVAVSLTPGSTQTVDFRLVPRKREIRLITG